MAKYGKPVWQHVLEAAKSLKKQTFSPTDIIEKVHKSQPEIPLVTIRSYVIAMAPNHPFSGHWPSTRKLHGVFEYLGDQKFQIKEKDAPAAAEAEPKKMFEVKRQLRYCAQCGYVTYKEKPPNVCPICRAKKEMFKELKAPI